jgi:hypothetical protein
MALRLMYDAAYPPTAPYLNAAAAAGYLGGNTPHAWTRGEWNDQAGMRYCPIWTGYLEDDPAQHANDAVTTAEALGWKAFTLPRRIIALDFEGEIDPAWVNTYADVVEHLGFDTVPYLSISAWQGGDPTRFSWWLPDWNGVPDLPAYPDVIGHQYVPDVPWLNTKVDLSVIDEKFWARLGRGART